MFGIGGIWTCMHALHYGKVGVAPLSSKKTMHVQARKALFTRAFIGVNVLTYGTDQLGFGMIPQTCIDTHAPTARACKKEGSSLLCRRCVGSHGVTVFVREGSPPKASVRTA